MEIKFKVEAYEKVKSFVTECEKEIMGIGKIKVVRPGIILVEDIQIFEQEVTSASTEFDKDKFMEFIAGRVREGDVQDWRLWWHSHADMSPFWSVTDTDNIERIGETADWMLSIVFNHKLEYKSRLDIFRPTRLTEEEGHITIDYPINDEIKDWARKEIEEKVTEKTYRYDKNKDDNYDKWDREYKWGKKWGDSKQQKLLTTEEKVNFEDEFSTMTEEEERKLISSIEYKFEKRNTLSKKETAFIEAHEHLFSDLYDLGYIDEKNVRDEDITEEIILK
jgi:hypothetical protein